MKSNIFFKVIIFCCVFLNHANCYARSPTKDEAISFANSKGKELLMSFQEPNIKLRYEKLDNLFLQHLDVDYISKFVVGKYWKIMDHQQREKYQELFKRYGLSYYKTLPLDFANNLTYEIINAEVEKDYTNVASVIHVNLNAENPQNVALVFKLRKANNVIKVVDVKVAESSMLLAYRSKFYEMIAKNEEEIDWFLEDLEDITRSYELSLQENAMQK
jgi:phospholipid transport system substrate-binding protein